MGGGHEGCCVGRVYGADGADGAVHCTIRSCCCTFFPFDAVGGDILV